MTNHPNRGRAQVHLSFDTSRRRRQLESYRVNIQPAPDTMATTGALRQTGEVFNGVVTYRGVFENRRRAFEAVAAYVDAEFAVMQQSGPDGESIRLGPVKARARSEDEHGNVYRVLFRHMRQGDLITPDA